MARRKKLRGPRFTIEVSQEILSSAEKRDSAHCMIADAVKAARPHAKHISVDLQTVRFTEDGRRFTYLTPRAAQVALVRFDQGIEQQPWHVQLSGPQSTEAQTKAPSPQPKPRKPRARLAPANGPHAVPEKIGGKTPPRIPGGSRRAFGLRAFQL